MKDSKIEWTDHTFNPWIGCSKVSPGCENCYAEELMDKRLKKVEWGPGNPRSRTGEGNWNEVRKWNASAREEFDKWLPNPLDSRPWPGPQTRVFCASLADWLDPEVPIEWLVDLLELIRTTPFLDWLLLTKRPELWSERIKACANEIESNIWPLKDLYFFLQRWLYDRPPQNVWIGTTVEDQKRADQRIPAILKIPAVKRFLSCEPLLGPLELVCPLSGDALHTNNGMWVDWIICGGESGRNARPMHPDWVRSLRDQCENVHHTIPFFFKQWGEWFPSCQYTKDSDFTEKAQWTFDDENTSWWVGKKAAGRLLDGVEHNGIPTS